MNECSSALICSRTPHRTIITGTQQCECCSKSNVSFYLQASFKGFTEFKSRQLRSEHGCAFRIALLALNRTVLSSVSPYLPHNCTVPALYCGAKKKQNSVTIRSDLCFSPVQHHSSNTQLICFPWTAGCSRNSTSGFGLLLQACSTPSHMKQRTGEHLNDRGRQQWGYKFENA